MDNLTYNSTDTDILIGNLLSSSHEITRKILAQIDFYDLLRAVQVCSTWARVGKSILHKERRFRFTTLSLKECERENQSTYNCDELSELFLKRITTKPTYCLGIYCQEIDLGENFYSSNFPNGTSLTTILRHHLPNTCEVMLIPGYGVVGSMEKEETTPSSNAMTLYPSKDSFEPGQSSEYPVVNFNNVGDSIEHEDAPLVGGNCSWINPNAVSLLLLPKQPGVQLQIFNLTEKEFYKTYRPSLRSRLKSIQISPHEFNSVCSLSETEDLKAFLIFTSNLKAFTRAFISAAQSRQNDELALGGVVLEMPPSKGGVKVETIGVAISGHAVRTASVVVPSRVRNKEELIPYLEKLKSFGLPETHSVCFMFSCCGRGSHWYGRNKEAIGDEFCNIETRAFRKLFPVTPVFGLFGGGEIGNNFGGKDDTNEIGSNFSAKKLKKKQTIFHQYSTVFILVSIV